MHRVCGVRPAVEKLRAFVVFIKKCLRSRGWSGINYTAAAKCTNQTKCKKRHFSLFQLLIGGNQPWQYFQTILQKIKLSVYNPYVIILIKTLKGIPVKIHYCSCRMNMLYQGLEDYFEYSSLGCSENLAENVGSTLNTDWYQSELFAFH